MASHFAFPALLSKQVSQLEQSIAKKKQLQEQIDDLKKIINSSDFSKKRDSLNELLQSWSYIDQYPRPPAPLVERLSPFFERYNYRPRQQNQHSSTHQPRPRGRWKNRSRKSYSHYRDDYDDDEDDDEYEDDEYDQDIQEDEDDDGIEQLLKSSDEEDEVGYENQGYRFKKGKKKNRSPQKSKQEAPRSLPNPSQSAVPVVQQNSVKSEQDNFISIISNSLKVPALIPRHSVYFLGKQ